jgi:hypothetical protein
MWLLHFYTQRSSKSSISLYHRQSFEEYDDQGNELFGRPLRTTFTNTKHAAYEWTQTFDKFLKDNKFVRASGDLCVYIKWSDTLHVAVILGIIIVIYDDALIVFPSSE